MGKADISSKRLIALAPDGWVKWVTQTPDMVAQNLLDSEFQWISRETDTLIKAYSPTTGEILALNEFQFRPHPRMPRRIRAYAGLAEEKYNLRVYPVLINIFPPEGNTPILDHYESEVLGLKARQDYRVINLWETDVELAFEPNLKGLLPLAPVMKDGASETILRRASLRLQNEERGEDLQRLLGIFATFVLGTNLVEQVMDLERQALLESPWGQAILEQGEERGEQRGREQGREEGREEGREQEAIRILQRLLQRRFGEVPELVETTLQRLNVEQLEELSDRLIEVNSLDEFIAALPPITEE